MAETAPDSRRQPSSHGPFGFRLIGIMKLSSGLLTFAAWLEMFRFFGGDVAAELEWLARHLRLDPENRLFHLATGWIGRLDQRHVRWLEAGTLFYAVLHVVEGVGLILERYWAGYLMVIATCALVPFELYEIYQKVNPLKIGVLLVNLALLVYVVIKLRQEHLARVAARRQAAQARMPSSRV